MKKIRYLPFGYTIRNGQTVIDQQEAETVRGIFTAYIHGASLKEIAEDLTAKNIPYTERSCVWDKARISRILENAKYTGDAEFDAIIEDAPRPYPLRKLRRAHAPAHQLQAGRPGKLDVQQHCLRPAGANQRW